MRSDTETGKAPLPPDETERMAALRGYEILDTDPEREFDDITLLASQICGTPIALISLVDDHRQWFKSKVGMTEEETSRDIAFCSHGILAADLFIVADALADARFANNPLVTTGARIRFYAGAPLVTPDGHAVGMVCVNDSQPRTLTPDQQNALRALGRQVVALLELRRTAIALRSNEERFREMAESISEVFWLSDPTTTRILYVSPAYETIWGRSCPSLYENPRSFLESIHPDDREGMLEALDVQKTAGEYQKEYRVIRPDGSVRWIWDRGFPIRNATGELVRVAGIAQDVTERRRLGEQMYQFHKMETVGKLAGGVAHEFNSIMTTIICQTDLLLDEVPADSPSAIKAQDIRAAADRAAMLTKQLLAYGRKQVLQPEVLDLGKVLARMECMLRQVLGDRVDMRIVATDDVKSVKADAGQIEHVILQLALNAADAMSHGGRLTVETANVTFDDETVAGIPELKAGNYVMLAVTDTGAGMSDDVRRRAFEPFFTTKDIGKGTGLGLATCYGIVRQSGGHISVYSELGRGTSVKVYIPQIERGVEARPSRDAAASLARGTETILLVEDDSLLRGMAKSLLERLGYTVLAAGDGATALRIVEERGNAPIDLLFTDVVMPGMSGTEVADRLRQLLPSTRVLFTSGFTENAIVHQGVLEDGVALLLPKPFTPSALASKVREVLDRAACVTA